MDRRMDSPCSPKVKITTSLLYLIILLFILPIPASAGWKLERVEAPRYFMDGFFSPRGIAVDYAGVPHIVYGGDHLYHARLKDGKWGYEVIDGSSGVGSNAAIAVDSAGKIHVAYRDDSTQPGIKYATNVGGRWETSVVDGTTGALYYVSIALDSGGKAHICYYDSYNGDLRYATNQTGVWRAYTVDSAGDVGQYCSIAVDSKKKVHISYYDDYYNDLKYATNASGVWVTSVLDSGVVYAGFHTSIVVDAKDKVHISYFDIGSVISLLKYCSNETGSWKVQIIDGTDTLGSCSSIAVDGNNRTHITYYDYTNANLKYATNATTKGDWQVMVADSTGDVGRYNAIALKGNGSVHLAYLDYTNNNLKYATGGLAGFTEQNVDHSGRLERETSVAIDKNNGLHVAYIDSGENTLKYATNASGAWKIYAIDPKNQNGLYYLSIAVDGNCKAHIAYYKYTPEGMLKYATNASGVWKIYTVDSKGNVGAYPSIAVDGSNRPHISYCDRTNHALKYAANASGSWKTSTIETIGSVGNDTGIAVDSGNKVHISYFYSVGGLALKYATNQSGSWKTYSLDNKDYPGWFTSIAVDSQKKVHISYMSLLNSDVKYATNASGTWKLLTIDSAADGGWGNSIAVDSNRKVHISYLDDKGKDLKYATNASGVWKYAFIDRTGYVGADNDIAVDPGNKVHIVYRDALNYDLRHASNATSLFTLQVEKQGTGGGLVTDSSGQINCGPLCEARLKQDPFGEETLTPTAFRDSVFIGWGGGCSGRGPCALTIDNDSYVSARFDLKLPMSPSRLTALAMSKTNIDLTWQDNSNNESGFIIERKKGATGSYAVIGQVGPNVTKLSIGSHEPDTQYFFRVKAFNQTGVSSYSNEANAFTALFIKVAYPNGGQKLMASCSWKIGWTFSGNVGSYVRIELLKGGVYYKTIASSVSIGKDDYGTSGWRIPYNETIGPDYRIRVTSTSDSNYQDQSDSNFSITSGIAIQFPNGGEIWKAGSAHELIWAYTSGVNPNVKIQLFRGGVPDIVITPAVSIGSNGQGNFNWTIPGSQPPSNMYKVRVTTADNLFWDESNYSFTITAP